MEMWLGLNESHPHVMKTPAPRSTNLPLAINLSPQCVMLARSCGFCQNLPSQYFFFFKATVHSCGILKHCERTPPLLSLSLSLSLLCLHHPSLLPPTGRPNLNEAQQLKRLIIQINIWTHPFSLSHSNIHITVAKRGGIRRDCQCANPDGFSFLFFPPTNWPPDKI